MPVKKTPDGRIIEEKTKAVGFGGSERTQIVGRQGGGSRDNTVLSSGGDGGGRPNMSGRDALDDKTKLVGRGGQTEPLRPASGGREGHLGGTKPIGSPSGGGSASSVGRGGRHGNVTTGGGGSPKTKLVRGNKPATEAPHSETDDPVAGWLVVEKGPGKGRSVNLGLGMNTVGRGASARVRVNFGDETLSGEKHFLVSYDPRSSHFAIHLGDSANLTYLNGAPVYETMQLSNFDVIEAGQTQLRFVAFCGENFSWDE